jgi:hypothetical protein
MKNPRHWQFGQSLALAIALASLSTPASAQSAQSTIHIEAQPLSSALEELARQSGTDILFRPESVGDKRARPINGKMSARQALDLLLQGTGLTYSSDGSGAITIKAVQTSAQDEGNDGLYNDVIVVTGVTEKTSKFKTSYAISTLSQDQVAKTAPQSTADLIGKIPGFFSEASGGESNNNISPRGLPGNGTQFLALQEDGMLLFQDPND